MWTRVNRWVQVTDGTFLDCAGIALQGNRLQVIVSIPAGQNRVGAVMATFTVQPAMSDRLAKELTRILSILGLVAVSTPRLIHPGRPVFISQRFHPAHMAIHTFHLVIICHGSTQALRIRSRMASITIRGFIFMFAMHCRRKRRQARFTRQPQSGVGMALSAQNRISGCGLAGQACIIFFVVQFQDIHPEIGW